MAAQVLIGTSSWADPGFVEEWYPKGLPDEERLPYYARHFDLVEVNSTFYAVPARETVERWCEQTPDRFVFDVKLHKLLSRHSTPIGQIPSGQRATAKLDGRRVVLTPELEKEVAQIFLHSIEPLEEAGKLGSIMAQLSPGFSPRSNHLEELDPLIGVLGRRRIAVELRNRGWLSPERMEETLAFFEERDLTFVCVDAPFSDHFTVMPRLDVVTSPKLAYLRMHGRNREGYVRGRTVPERFDYDYSDDELREHADRAERLADEATKVHILYNNNKGAYAPEAAERLREMLGQRAPTKAAA
jgi:uncharacterized protein YecE (DUF72 family)